MTLINHWTMDDSIADSVVVDSVGGNNGAYQGANTEDKTVSGKIATALSFAREYILLASTINLTPDWTITLWAKSLVESPTATFDSQLIGDISDIDNQFYILNSSKAKFYTNQSIAAEWTDDTDFYNKWRFFTLIGTTNTMELFLDAVSQGTKDLGAFDANFDVASIAAGHTQVSTRFTGHIDDVRIYDTALSQGGIDTLYALGTTAIIRTSGRRKTHNTRR